MLLPVPLLVLMMTVAHFIDIGPCAIFPISFQKQTDF